jgi:SAM-dependent methyltransferase
MYKNKTQREKNLNRFSDFQSVRLSNHYYLELKPIIICLISSTQKYASGKVLDIACGNKPYEKLFSHCKSYLGCDIVQSSNNKVDIICDATNIPLESNTFNTVISTQSIEHIANYGGMLQEAYRLLKSGGYLILSGPMYWHLHEEPYDFFRFTKHGFKYILEEVGFDVIEVLPNGGKWAMFGQMVIHTFPHRLVRLRWFRKWNNWFFEKLDNRYFDDINTMNYVAIAKKP